MGGWDMTTFESMMSATMHVTVTPRLHRHHCIAVTGPLCMHACVCGEAGHDPVHELIIICLLVCSQMRKDGLPKPAPEAHPDESGVGESETTRSPSPSAAPVDWTPSPAAGMLRRRSMAEVVDVEETEARSSQRSEAVAKVVEGGK